EELRDADAWREAGGGGRRRGRLFRCRFLRVRFRRGSAFRRGFLRRRRRASGGEQPGATNPEALDGLVAASAKLLDQRELLVEFGLDPQRQHTAFLVEGPASRIVGRGARVIVAAEPHPQLEALAVELALLLRVGLSQRRRAC